MRIDGHESNLFIRVNSRFAFAHLCGLCGYSVFAMKANKAVFLDRDGVINRPIIVDGKTYPARTVADFEILPGVNQACSDLKKAGYLLIVVTNQPDVGRGILKKEVVEAIHQTMMQHLPIDRVEVCYHAGAEFGEECECRKPRPGMLFAAAKKLAIDLSRSFMIGDRWRDVECGRNAGCRTIFIHWNYQERLKHQPDYTVSDLLEAARLIQTLVIHDPPLGGEGR
jgi:D-glycero-D-manno-heptose 1,7-bisphosphate phosphatase